MAAQWCHVLVVPSLPTSSSRRRCSSSWLVPASPSAAGLPAPGASATLSDIAAAGNTNHHGLPAGTRPVAPGLRHLQALHSPALSYLAPDVPSREPVRCHLPGRTGLRRRMEPPGSSPDPSLPQGPLLLPPSFPVLRGKLIGPGMHSTLGTGTRTSPGAPGCAAPLRPGPASAPGRRCAPRTGTATGTGSRGCAATTGTGIGTSPGAPGCAAPPGYRDTQHPRG